MKLLNDELKITLAFFKLSSKITLTGNTFSSHNKRCGVSDFPTELKYASSHEWARLESDGIVVVGITDHAQDALGDIVFIELPESGDDVVAGAEVAVVESVKAASDIYSPVAGEVLEVNSALEDEPELVNASPYEDGWLFTVKLSAGEDLSNLLDADGYQSVVEDE